MFMSGPLKLECKAKQRSQTPDESGALQDTKKPAKKVPANKITLCQLSSIECGAANVNIHTLSSFFRVLCQPSILWYCHLNTCVSYFPS